MNGIFGLAHRIIFKVNARWDWGWKSQRIIKFSPYKITAIVKQNHFQNIMKFWILKCSTIERRKFTIQTFPCIKICCFGVENGEFKWFHLYLIMPSSIQREKCGTLTVWFNKSGYTGIMFLFYAHTSDITRVSTYSHIWYTSKAYCL